MRLRQEQARQAMLHQQQVQGQVHMQPQQQMQPGMTVQQHQQQQPGVMPGVNFVGPNGQFNYAAAAQSGYMNPGMMNSGLMQSQMAAAAAAAAAGQMPEGLSEAEKRNFAATRQAMFNRNPMLRAGVGQGGVTANQAQLQQFQAQQMFHQQQQRQLQAQALQVQQAQNAQAGQMGQNPQAKMQQQPQQGVRAQPQQLPNQLRQVSVTPGHTPQMAPGQTPAHGSPAPPHQGPVNAQHLQPPHRNSPVDGDVPSHSPTPQTGSPNKRQRLSPAEGNFNQQMNGQGMVANGGVQFNPQFQAGMVQVKPGMIPPQQQAQFANMTPHQRQAMLNNMMPNGMANQQPVVTPGGTQMMPSGSPGENNDFRQLNQRMPPNNALQDYQNQLMQLERVNQQRLTEGGSQQQPNGAAQRTPSTGGQNFKGRPNTAGSPANTENDQNKPVSPHSDANPQQQFNGHPNGWPQQQQGQSPHIGQRRPSPQSLPPGHQMPPPNGPVANVQNSNGTKTQPSSPSNPSIPAKVQKQLSGKGKKDGSSPKRRSQAGGNKKAPATPVASSEPPTPTTPATPHAGPNSSANGHQQQQQSAQPQSNAPNAAIPNSSDSKVNASTRSNTPNDKDDSGAVKNGAPQQGGPQGDVEMSDSLLFPPQDQSGGGGPGGGPMNGMHGQPNMVGGPMQGGEHLDDPNFLADFGNGDNDVGELDFDFGTFLNEEGTSGGMGFDGGFNWNEGVETGNDM